MKDLRAKAVQLSRQGHYKEAIPLAEHALALAERALGPEHPDTATTLNNLAHLYSVTGAYAKAEPLYQRVLAFREKTHGTGDLDTATTLADLAFQYKTTGAYAKAAPLYERALAIHEKALGPPVRGLEHLFTAHALKDLPSLPPTGAYAKAEPLYQRALAVSETALGLGIIGTPPRRSTILGSGYAPKTGSWLKTFSGPGALPLRSSILVSCTRLSAPIRLPCRSISAPWTSARKCSVPSIPIPVRQSAILQRGITPSVNSPKPSRSTSAPWRFARGPSAPSIPTPPPRSTVSAPYTYPWVPTTRQSRFPARPGHPRESARPRASRHRHCTRQPRHRLSHRWRLRQSRAAISARAGDLREETSAPSI